jgi:hypothetical protein
MKKAIASFLFIFFCLAMFAQKEVTFSFSFNEKRPYAFTTITVYVNEIEAVKLKNGSTLNYKATLDVSQPVTVFAEVGFNNQGKTFFLSPENKCSLEIGFSGGLLTLDLLSGGKLAPGTGSKSNLSVNKKNLSISYTSETTDASDTIRLQWLDKGGKIIGSSNVCGANLTYMSDPGYKMTGFGGLYTLSVRFLNFKVPEYKPGVRSWSSLVFGCSYMNQINFNKIKMEAEGMEPMKYKSTTIITTISPDMGFTFGLGKFKSPTKWKGIALEITYKPSIMQVYSFSKGDLSDDAFFNWTGFGVDVNFNSFVSNAAKLAPKAQSKLTFFFLPPLKDIPLYISFGYGLTIYKHRK